MPEDPKRVQDDPDHRAYELPSLGEPPAPPKLDPKLPPHPAKPDTQQAADYSKAAIASTAASAFIMPIIILCLGGYLLDVHLKHTISWLAAIGVVLGLVVGITALMRILERLSR